MANRKNPPASRVLRLLVGVIAALAMPAGAKADEITRLAAPAPFESLSQVDIRRLAASTATALLADDSKLTLKLLPAHSHAILSGRCMTGSRVIITSKAIQEANIASCMAGTYSAEAKLPDGASAIASQMTRDGSLVFAKYEPQAEAHQTLRKFEELQQPGPVPAASYLLQPGNHHNLKLSLSANEQPGPLIIDGGGRALLDGRTRIRISRPHVVLRGIEFGGDVMIEVAAPDVTIENSLFRSCGPPDRPLSQCILLGPQARGTEIAFNRFEGSHAMSIKLRAGDDPQQQPANTFIHHNEFRNIQRLSKNGQEPIQVAGPGGGASGFPLSARIEHNIFEAAEGDVEAISIKSPNVSARWNIFARMDAAPNLRGGEGSELSGNLLLRTRGIRVAGRGHQVEGNIILCPTSPAVLISHGTQGYAAADKTRVAENLIAGARTAITFKAQERQVLRHARDSTMTGNIIQHDATLCK